MKTRHKINVARLMYVVVGFARALAGRRADRVEVRRGGVRWDLDLREGIDFAIYLVGYFEYFTYRSYAREIGEGAVVLDVGANIGAHTLQFARMVGPRGVVVAIEPTGYAFAKLERNLALNPDIAGRVRPRHTLLRADASGPAPSRVHSGWPLAGDRTELDPDHCGKPHSVSGASHATLDEVVAATGLERVDFVKIDVDGAEWSVLRGARRTLERHRPTILMELAPGLFKSRPGEFASILAMLGELGYAPEDANRGRALPRDEAALLRLIPEGASRNAVLRPLGARHRRARAIIERKPALRRFYREIYASYRRCAERARGDGMVVELGSGGGLARDEVPGIVTTDVAAAPGIDLEVDARAMPFKDASVRAICMWNVFHHIPDAAAFLSEARRCLTDGGRVLLVEPYPGWPSGWIYRFAHHEPYHPDAREWGFKPGDPLADANIALPWIVFDRDRERLAREYPELELVRFERRSPLTYWLTGGLRRWTLLPGWAFGLAAALDRALIRVLPSSASFVEIELVRRPRS